MPSSTIQVIGANNALFKHLKGKATSPKAWRDIQASLYKYRPEVAAREDRACSCLENITCRAVMIFIRVK